MNHGTNAFRIGINVNIARSLNNCFVYILCLFYEFRGLKGYYIICNCNFNYAKQCS